MLSRRQALSCLPEDHDPDPCEGQPQSVSILQRSLPMTFTRTHQEGLSAKVAHGYSFHNELYFEEDHMLSLSPDDTLAFKDQRQPAPLRVWPHIAKDIWSHVAALRKVSKEQRISGTACGTVAALPIPYQRSHRGLHRPFPPANRNFNAITVFVDKLAKLAHFVPGTTTFFCLWCKSSSPDKNISKCNNF
ncbi:hypothetical protein EMPS_07811 [Entomortierella parvispora]|uniref:Uncharacterized protein n=1 Tax=Entomortierella parvispora TaxID=205924 RepID=A0A9P3HFK0_9FUNG|nr:hypothetical protein EMPS_07811 [Entomortierella parvispora]